MSRGGAPPASATTEAGIDPVPSRTRQLSPPSPRVLQRQAAGGQGVALAEGAFLHARERPRRPAGPAGGPDPPAGPCCVYAASKCSQVPFRVRGPAACGLVLCSGGRFLHAGPFLVQGERMLFRLLSASTRDVAGMRFADVAGIRNAKPWITVLLGRLRTCALRGGGRLRRSLFHCDAHCFASSFHSSGKYGVSCASGSAD